MFRILQIIFLSQLFLHANISYGNKAGKSQVKIMKEARKLPFKKLSYFDKGVYGKIGNATVFVTSYDMIEDYDRLYWSMVLVLSKKYACFITSKQIEEDQVRFYCKDTRTIVMKRNMNKTLVYFYAYQYWNDGSLVENKDLKPLRKSYAH
jgi:hypothetical protein